MGFPGFVHLHCHSAFSLLEGTATPQSLVSAAKRLKVPALAITDRNGLYGAVAFYLLAQKAGIKPLIGMEVDLDDGHSLVLLARDMAGYRNLCHLATVLRLNWDPETLPPAGYDEEDDEEVLPWDSGVWGVPVFGFTGKERPGSANAKAQAMRWQKEPRLPSDLLLSGRHARGLVALSGGRRGLVNSLVAQGKMEQAARAAGMLLSAFGEGNFFIELQAIDAQSRESVPRLVELASGLGIPVVATNDVLYLAPEDTQAALALAAARARFVSAPLFREAPLEVVEGRLQAKENAGLQEEVGSERYLKSAEEMAALFAAHPQALANTTYIAEQCNLELPLHKPLFPGVGLREGETAYSRLWKLCFAGATRLYKPLTEPVISRLKYELEIIEGLGFCPYFLVVYDIVRFARSRDIPVLARGSAADSLVAYVLGITQVDPLAHNLLFERFLNPFRAEFELPDIDLDLCWRRRDEVLHYVYGKYGREHVATVGTHITFGSRSAWREMAKALGLPAQRIGYIASRLHDLDRSEDDPDEEEPEPDDADAPALPRFRDETEQKAFELHRDIEGLPRHMGMHCAGVVITPGDRPLADLVPLQRAARDASMAITQYEKDALEAMGLVKMDLLGSRALTTLVDALEASGLAQARGDLTRCLETIPLDDEATYRMMAEGDTLGCFQLESPGMRGLLKWLMPHSMDHMAAAISLFRPGPLEGGFLEMFMRRHLGFEAVTYPHPGMETVLKDTRGVILFQEQFLQLAHDLAGLDMGEAEKLRKELGKTHSPEEREGLGARFVAGAIERGISQMQAEKVWGVIAGYSGFGFCKAHACSYAVTAYRTAYMKAHYPAQYMAALINNQGGFYGPSVYVEDARRHRIEILPPHVNESGAWCEVPQGERAIRFGLQFVKGLSEKTIGVILQERRNGGHFRSLLDLMARVEMGTGEVAALVKVGACDGLGAEDMRSIAPVRGSLGEVMGAVRDLPALNRRQMVWLLPTLLASGQMRSRTRGVRSALAPTGSDGQAGNIAMQIIMDEIARGSEANGSGGYSNPRILGSSILHLETPALDDYSPAEKLHLEREALGFTLSHNEMSVHARELEEHGVIPSVALHRHGGREVMVAGVVAAGRRHIAKDGGPMLFLTLQDAHGLVESVLFPEAYKESAEMLANGGYGPFLVKGQVQVVGKGRGIGVQPPANLRLTDAVTMKMHPVVIVSGVELLENSTS